MIAAGVGILKPPASHGIPYTGPSDLAWRWLCWLPWLTRDGFQDVNQFATLRRHEHSLRMGKSADLGIPWRTLDFILQILGLINYKCDCDSKHHQDQKTPPSMNPHYPLLRCRGKTQEIPGKRVWNSFSFFFEQVWDFFLDFLAGTICLVFATVWNLNLSFCMVFATFGHVHLPFCMGFTTCGHVHLPFCMVFATFWHVHLPFCMGSSTCEHVHPNIYRCGSLGLDKKRVGGIEGGH